MRYLLWLAAACAAGADESSYSGALSCRPCHLKQFESQSLSGHARTLHSASGHPLAAQFAPANDLTRPPNFRFAFTREAATIGAKISDGQNELEIPVDWAFGSGTRGVTFVSRIGGGVYLEHAFSFYPQSGVFDLTPGHRRLPARSLMEAAGQTFRLQGGGRDIRDCFRCHSTGAVTISSRQEVGISEAGVRCEACHGPGGRHRDAAARGDLPQARRLIRNPRSLPAEDQIRFCGSCHRSPDGAGAVNDFTNPWNVRHQPPYLDQSKCFRGSKGALSCSTCHAPHEPLRRADAAYYSARCATCHTDLQWPPAGVCVAETKPDCTRCHMPAVWPDPRLSFRNHWIGVYRAGPYLIPAR